MNLLSPGTQRTQGPKLHNKMGQAVVMGCKSVSVFSSLLLLGALIGCVPKEELDSDDLDPSMDWEDILSHDGSSYGVQREESASSAAESAPFMSKKQAMDAHVERSRTALLGDIHSILNIS